MFHVKHKLQEWTSFHVLLIGTYRLPQSYWTVPSYLTVSFIFPKFNKVISINFSTPAARLVCLVCIFWRLLTHFPVYKRGSSCDSLVTLDYTGSRRASPSSVYSDLPWVPAEWSPQFCWSVPLSWQVMCNVILCLLLHRPPEVQLTVSQSISTKWRVSSLRIVSLH